MTALTLELTGEEIQCLLELLEATLKETQVEEHRTRKPSYREYVVHREELLVSLLEKIRQHRD